MHRKGEGKVTTLVPIIFIIIFISVVIIVAKFADRNVER